MKRRVGTNCPTRSKCYTNACVHKPFYARGKRDESFQALRQHLSQYQDIARSSF
ncbi:Uncharacterised protein [BD1-7 clade bacterium]|nr:Uncharacterised protein [BD1-7 clade bacterium]